MLPVRDLFVAVACCVFAQAQERINPATVEAIEKAIALEMSAQQIPGMSIAIAKGGEIWSAGYGWADLENDVAVKASTLFRTASVAKPMTSIAAMSLVEAGKLDLDAPVKTYLPSFGQGRMSMRQLLGHRGGIRAYRGEEGALARHFPSLADALKIFEADAVVAEPGAAYLYSTFGYVLAGRVMEAATGTAFLDLLRASVLAKAGMTDTQADDLYRIIPGRARGYYKSAAGEVFNSAPHDTSYKIPGGGLLSTSPDLVRFAMALNTGKLLQPSSVDVLFTPQRTNDGKSTGYGLGWGIRVVDHRREMVHTGGQIGVSTILIYLPDQHAALAMMFNLENVKMDALASTVIEIALVGRVP